MSGAWRQKGWTEPSNPGQRGQLGSLASFRENSFVALNTALFQGGVALRVAPGVEVDRPIQILFLTHLWQWR